MPDLPSSSSFIPKRTTGTRIRQKGTRNFFLLSIISYACLIAAPTASAAVYVYKIYTERQFEQVVAKLDEAISGFNEAEMARVLEFDRRLKFAEHLVDTHISVVKALGALENNTIGNAGFRSLAIKRLDEQTLLASGELIATDFDAALFQRGAYKNTEAVPLGTAQLTDITFVPPTEVGGEDVITFKGEFTFAASDIAFTVGGATAQPNTDTAKEDGQNKEDIVDSQIISDERVQTPLTDESL
jgi:hypothetical protein